MQKSIYETPDMDITWLVEEDIITASGDGDNDTAWGISLGDEDFGSNTQ